jgi:hypothetical protein
MRQRFRISNAVTQSNRSSSTPRQKRPLQVHHRPLVFEALENRCLLSSWTVLIYMNADNNASSE